ncbi:DUF202 domain-containing protein [Pseudomonas sp. NPDC087342]|uniref:DUF202 domain-containing protein n=1 Tax=Pseudomonas sp. NPDC087342 TaxID=3364437 RepID=UPI003806B394
MQPERTDLAWKRTQILLMLVACLVLRCLQHHPLLSTTLLTLIGLLVLLILVEQGLSYRRALLGIVGQGAIRNSLPLLILAMCTALLAALALIA